ncbi:MAG: hypothetical protein ACIAXF_13665 [Phycisphaerales bacterium JB063]
MKPFAGLSRYAFVLALLCPGVASAQPAQDAGVDTEQADALEDIGVVGTWYAQRMYGEWIAPDSEFRLEFRADGTAHAFEDGRAEDDIATYTLDEDRGVIIIHEPNGQMQIEIAYLRYDDVMILTVRPPEGFEDAFGDEDMELELSLRPEGNAEQQRARAAFAQAMRDEAGQVEEMQPVEVSLEELLLWRLEDLADAAYSYHTDEGSFPATLGGLYAYMFSPESFCQPAQGVVRPEDWGDLSADDRVAWINANTGYGYIGGDAATLAYKREQWDAPMLFELPLFEGSETVSLITVGGTIEVLDYDEADALVKEQTGRDLMEWMEHLGREQLPPREAEGADADAGGGDAAGPADSLNDPGGDVAADHGETRDVAE